jgi:stearoyl-CoA desaturase (delta-9 desaturase)
MIELIKPNKYIPTLMQLLTPVAIYMGVTSGASWAWWIVAALMFFGYRVIGHGVALHRYYSHNQFTTNWLGEIILGFFGLMSCSGSPASYAMMHLIHHKYPDTDKDPHGPARGLKSFFYVYWQTDWDLRESPVFTRRLIQLKNYWWMHQTYWPLILLIAAVMYLISYELFLFAWFIPVCLNIWEIAYSTYFSHWDFKTKSAKPTNHGNINIWLYPHREYLHEVHHMYPTLGDHATRPGEIDWTYQCCRLFAREWKLEKLKY